MFYNSLLERVVLPIGDWFNKSSFTKELKYWRVLQSLSKEELENKSHQNLSAILNHASLNIPYFKELNIKPNPKNPANWLQDFPIINKHDIKENFEAFYNDDLSKLIVYESSGSSGIQGKILMNKKEQSTIRAILILWWEWAGYKMGKPIAQTGMTPNRGLLKTFKDIFFKTYYFVAFGLNRPTILKALINISNRRIKHFAGYASSLFLFAKVAGEEGINVQFDSVISWGDKMFPHYRKEIERVFKTKVFDTYACNEGLMIAAQCDLPYYYIMSPHVYVEIVDDNGDLVEDGKMGHVIVTRLDNYSMPLIRYRNGDLAVKLPRNNYPEKRKFQFPLLERVIGRDTDIIKTRSGKYLIVHFFTGIFEFYPSIKQFRVIQNTLDAIEIEYIKDVGFVTSILNEITTTIHEHLGEKLSIIYTCVDSIPVTPSGKPQIIKSTLVDKKIDLQ